MNVNRKDLANAIRALSMDAVEKAKSGHPGMPMGMADVAEVLWNDYLKHNPATPNWVDRDRFVVSNGHGSMLLYSLLHLSGYELPMSEIKQFRQLGSMTPGHPEYGDTPGVETTTGPLGQGLANAVGMAIAERVFAAQFNRQNHSIIDHYTYVFVGDGCLMEGISHEACSLAGTLGLGKLIVFYDDNGISIDGEVKGWFTDDTPKRFAAYGWHVVANVDGHDPSQIKAAIDEARTESTRPTLISCKTVIGYGAPNKQGKAISHGAPLGAQEIQLARENIAWPYEPFQIPDEIYAAWDAGEKGAQVEAEWTKRFAQYSHAYPDLAAELKRRIARQLPTEWQLKTQQFINQVDSKATAIATRKASQNTLNGYGPMLPELIGGSADLAESNLTIWSGCKTICDDDYRGNYINFGVREFAMSAITNGIALHGGFIPYCATFLMFSEYARNALRMAALMRIPSIFVFTHDSIGLGEDGPTHQPIEQTASLRLIPNMSTWRPADSVETAIAWKVAIERAHGPTCLLFSRQTLAAQTRTSAQVKNIERGAYILRDTKFDPNLIIIATGSEVEIAMQAWKILMQQGHRVRLVSMPSTDAFDQQSEQYKESVLPSYVTNRVAVEAGVTAGWHKYVGPTGKIIGIDTFGKSAKGEILMKYLGFTADVIVQVVNSFSVSQPKREAAALIQMHIN